MVNNFYCGLGASIQLPEGHTSTIPLQIGLYHGDPLSVTIFNTVMNTYLDGLKSFQTKGYKFSNSNHSLYVLQYADDTCLTSDGPASCRAMLEFTEQWLQWSGMKAKPCKCQCLAVEASTGRTYDPNLQIQGEKIQFIGKEPIRFLGGTIQVPNNPSLMRENILAKLTTLLDRVDQIPITRKQKLKLYRLGICPRLSWELTISEFPISWVEKTLDSLVTRYLKKWSGLAKPADPVRLFLPIEDGGLNLSLPSTLYQKLQVGKASLLITSPDNVVSHTVKERIDKESQQQRAKFRPFTLAQQAYSANPGASGRAVSNRAKKMVGNEVRRKYLEHSMSLNTQGKLFQLVDNNASSIWAKAIQTLPPTEMKFALNAANDTLPHNANLARWRGLSDACKLCGARQTLHHILNHCKKALDLRRFNTRHDQVLKVIADFVKKLVPDDMHVIADLEDQYHFPPCLAHTDLRPDLIIYSELTKSATLMELTVCFETNFEEAKSRKETKYADLVDEIKENGFTVDLVTIEVGARGFLKYESFRRLNEVLGADRKEFFTLLLDVAKVTIKNSFRIWTQRNSLSEPDET